MIYFSLSLICSKKVCLQAFGSQIGDEGESTDREEFQLKEKEMRKCYYAS